MSPLNANFQYENLSATYDDRIEEFDLHRLELDIDEMLLYQAPALCYVVHLSEGYRDYRVRAAIRPVHCTGFARWSRESVTGGVLAGGPIVKSGSNAWAGDHTLLRGPLADLDFDGRMAAARLAVWMRPEFNMHAALLGQKAGLEAPRQDDVPQETELGTWRSELSDLARTVERIKLDEPYGAIDPSDEYKANFSGGF